MENEPKINEKLPLSKEEIALNEGYLEARLKLLEYSPAVKAYYEAQKRFKAKGLPFEGSDFSKIFEGHPDFELYQKLEKIGKTRRFVGFEGKIIMPPQL